MFCEEEEALNDEDDKKHLHMGRTRTFAHVPGNWSTYLYVPCKLLPALVSLTLFVARVLIKGGI